MASSCAHLERVVVLETKLEDLEKSHEAIIAKLEKIDGQLTKYHGFIGGIAFVLSGVGVLWSLGKDWLLTHFK